MNFYSNAMDNRIIILVKIEGIVHLCRSSSRWVQIRMTVLSTSERSPCATEKVGEMNSLKTVEH